MMCHSFKTLKLKININDLFYQNLLKFIFNYSIQQIRSINKGIENINANEIQYNGQSVAEYLVDFVMNQIPVDSQGNINKAVIDKLDYINSTLLLSRLRFDLVCP